MFKIFFLLGRAATFFELKYIAEKNILHFSLVNSFCKLEAKIFILKIFILFFKKVKEITI